MHIHKAYNFIFTLYYINRVWIIEKILQKLKYITCIESAFFLFQCVWFINFHFFFAFDRLKVPYPRKPGCVLVQILTETPTVLSTLQYLSDECSSTILWFARTILHCFFFFNYSHSQPNFSSVHLLKIHQVLVFSAILSFYTSASENKNNHSAHFYSNWINRQDIFAHFASSVR